MSKYQKNQDSNSAWVIDESGQTWTLGKNATISVAGTAAIEMDSAYGDNLIKVKGDLVATGAGSEGVRLDGDATLLKIGKSSSIEANDGIRDTGFGNDMVNAGVIQGIARGVYSDHGMDILNRGEISGEVAILAIGTNFIENFKSGVIEGDEVGIRLGPGSSTIFNHGVIRSEDVAITAGGMSNAWLVNTGRIVGDVFLGGGDDTIDIAAGRIKGVVDGGAGDDDYFVGKRSGQLSEGIGNGWDMVNTAKNFTLTANFEGLQLTGNKSINGTGNDGNNEIFGNDAANSLHGKGGMDFVAGGRGDDALRGGGGADDFVFHQEDDRDTIHDLDIGQDQVALLDFGFDDFSEIVPLMSQHGADTWISLGGGDRVVLKDIDMADLTDEMFIFNYVAAEEVM